MSSSTNPLSPENHIQTVRQLYLDASLLEQTIQQHVEASKVGYRSSNSSSHPSSPVNDHRRFNLSDTSSTTSHHSQRRQNSVSSTTSRRSGGGRQQQQTPPEEQGFQVPSSDHFRSDHEELSFLRDSLKDVYESVLLEDLVAAVEKSVDDRLWRYVFYAPVEELRAELRKLERTSSRRQEVMDELSKLLDKGTGFYHEMIMALRSEHNLDLGNIAVEVLQADSGTPNRNKPSDTSRFSQQQQNQQRQQQQPQPRSRNGRNRQQSKKEEFPTATSLTPTYSKESLASCIQKCFIYLGDLARYRTNIRLETQAIEATSSAAGESTIKSTPPKPSASDWQAAFRFYQRAIRVFPDSGKPYGQLAILSSYASDDIDALYWYCLSLGAKSPSVVVRDNLKVFFSRYQNRFKDLLASICPNVEDTKGAMAMSLDDDGEDEDMSSENEPNLAQQLALARCDLSVLLIKIQMDLFAPNLRSVTFHDSTLLDALCQKLSNRLASRGFESSAQKMVASIVFIVYDLHARTTLSSFPTESTTKEGSMGLKQAQRAGLIYLLRVATVLLDRQLLILSYLEGRKKGKSTASLPRLDQELMAPVHCLIEFWMSYWDQIWGMIRLEEKWAGVPSTSGSSDLSLKSAAVTFFRSFVNLLNMDRVQCADEPSVDDTSQRALCLLQQDRGDLYGLMPFRRFHLQLAPRMDTPENLEETRFSRLLLFAAKVIQASEGIRGTVIEMSFEPLGATTDSADQVTNRPSQYRVLDADDKRLLREKGSKMLASHWLQDQVTTLQKGLEETGWRSAQPGRDGDGVQFLKNNNNGGGRRDNTNKIPITMLPSMVKLPLTGQTRVTDHFQRDRKERTNSGGGVSIRTGGAHSPQSRPGRANNYNSNNNNHLYTNSSNSKYQGPPRWTCVVDMSVLVWNLSEIKTLLDHRQCLLIVPLDVIDRLDQAKKGQDKENQKTREAIRFLDDWLNIVRWGRTEPLLVGQNVKDSLGRWSEAVPYLVEEEQPEEKEEQEQGQEQEQEHVATNGKSEEDVNGKNETNGQEKRENGDGDTVMTESDTNSTATTKKQQQPDVNDTPTKQSEEETEVEVRNVMNVPRVWRPILGACLFMLRKREEAQRIPEDQFILLTEDPDLAYYAGWFDIPVSNIHSWKHHAI
ncbi:hypothetical protein BG015_008805 [Linnemannia schmuckeri]|uniref:PIN domain-containing protein n=1 Tax=Linnemannia schmuckeri TaxID=64567 RepID=A0A9P5V9V6_9FUNG|nr:hypothetical protein BG015_008805 [Linnemannia schmuckeri]